MKIIPHTLHSWCELGVITSVVYLFLIYATGKYGNRIIYAACAYVICIALIYAMSLHMLIPFIPYVTLLLAFYMLMPIAAHNKNKSKLYATTAVALDAQTWLIDCLKTVFNHPHNHDTITILIAHKDALENSVHNNIPLNIPWNHALFVSLLYDPHIPHGMIWLSQTGSLLGMNTQWIDQEKYTDSLAQHKTQTKIHAALVCIVNQVNRSCIIIDHGVAQAPKNIAEAVQYITLLTTHTKHLKEGTYNGARHERQNTHNHTP